MTGLLLNLYRKRLSLALPIKFCSIADSPRVEAGPLPAPPRHPFLLQLPMSFRIRDIGGKLRRHDASELDITAFMTFLKPGGVEA